jgi:hypothetical protein
MLVCLSSPQLLKKVGQLLVEVLVDVHSSIQGYLQVTYSSKTLLSQPDPLDNLGTGPICLSTSRVVHAP